MSAVYSAGNAARDCSACMHAPLTTMGHEYKKSPRRFGCAVYSRQHAEPSLTRQPTSKNLAIFHHFCYFHAFCTALACVRATHSAPRETSNSHGPAVLICDACKRIFRLPFAPLAVERADGVSVHILARDRRRPPGWTRCHAGALYS